MPRSVAGRLRSSALLRAGVVAARHRGLDDADVFIASYPRSGNTWLRFVLADLATGEEPDYESVEQTIPNVGWHRDGPRLTRGGGRLIKTHESYRRAYRNAIYLVRDFRDVLISQYRVYRPNPDDLSELDAFVEAFGTPAGSPYGAWRDHVRSWRRAAQSSDRIQIIRFEDMRADLAGTIGRIAAGLGLPADPERVEHALERNSAAAMHAKEETNREFLERAFGYMSRGTREGASGRWQELLSERHLETLAPEVELNAELGY